MGLRFGAQVRSATGDSVAHAPPRTHTHQPSSLPRSFHFLPFVVTINVPMGLRFGAQETGWVGIRTGSTSGW
jgi:hypothetical protein